MNKDAKIGLITLFIALSVFLVNGLREAGIVSFGSELGLIFSQVHGLRSGDTVTIGGVPRGKVLAIDFAPKDIQDRFTPLTGGVALVRAQVAFDTFRKIPRDSTYTVRTDLNGRRWLEITVSPSSEEIGPDEIFFAEESVHQDDQLETTIRTFSLLSQQTERLRDLLADPKFRLRTKDTASNLRFYSRELRAASARAPEQLLAFDESLDGQQNALMTQIQNFDNKTKSVRQRMTEMSPQLTESLKGWAARMERQGDRLTGTLSMAVQRSGDYKQMLDRALDGGYLDPKTAQALLLQAKKWARNLNEYRALAEDLHALTSDPTVRSDLKAAIDKFQIRSVEMNERIDKLEKRVDKNPLKPILGIPDTEAEKAAKAKAASQASSSQPKAAEPFEPAEPVAPAAPADSVVVPASTPTPAEGVLRP